MACQPRSSSCSHGCPPSVCAPRARLTAKNNTAARWPQSPLPPREASGPSRGSRASGRRIPSPVCSTLQAPPEPAGALRRWCCSHKPAGHPTGRFHLPRPLLGVTAPQISWLPAPCAREDLFCSPAHPPILPERPRSLLDGELLLRRSAGLSEDQPGCRAFSGAGPTGTGPTRGSPGLYTASHLSYTRIRRSEGPPTPP